MEFINALIHELFDKVEHIEFKETFENVELELNAEVINISSEEKLRAILNKFPDRDKVTIDVTLGADPISLYSGQPDIPEFLKGLSNLKMSLDEGETIKATVSISKKKLNDVLSIYNFAKVFEFLNSLSHVQLLSVFQQIIDTQVCFQCYDMDEELSTKNMHFVPSYSILKKRPVIFDDRMKRLDSIKTNCHYGSSSDFTFLPEDFRLLARSKKFNEFNVLFDKISLFQCIISLFDITSSENDLLFYKLSGYKTINGRLEFKNAQTNSFVEYYDIYEWAYEGGNLSDKIGLARNIVSIHLTDVNSIELKGNPFVSIKSGFEIYLKQNIKQYIEIRNKITDQLLEFNKRANSIVETFTSNFQKSIFTFLSFFASVFVLRILSKGDSANILTPDATILSFGFLAIAVIFLVFSVWELTKQKERFVKSYNNLKERYADLLLEGDIKKILNNDKDYNEDVEFIDQKKQKYIQMWIITLVIFFIVILWLFYISNSTMIFNFFKGCWKFNLRYLLFFVQ